MPPRCWLALTLPTLGPRDQNVVFQRGRVCLSLFFDASLIFRAFDKSENEEFHESLSPLRSVCVYVAQTHPPPLCQGGGVIENKGRSHTVCAGGRNRPKLFSLTSPRSQGDRGEPHSETPEIKCLECLLWGRQAVVGSTPPAVGPTRPPMGKSGTGERSVCWKRDAFVEERRVCGGEAWIGRRGAFLEERHVW